jgi:segregation and condensation protein B
MTDSKHSADTLLDADPMTDQEFPTPEGSEGPEPGTAQELEVLADEIGDEEAGEPVEAQISVEEPESAVEEQDAATEAPADGETAQAEATAGEAPTDQGDAADEAESSDQPDAQAESEEEAAPEPTTGPGEALTDDELVQAISALVFASPEPLATGRLVKLLERPRPARVKDALVEIQARLETAGLPLQLREIAGGWRLMTSPEQDESVARLVKARKNEKLSPAGLETLAVVAYRQPVTKADIEAIRGVQCGPMLRNLVDRGLAKVVGRADVPGGPLQYGTTKEFLDRFGMGSLKDLPRDAELLKE